MLADGTNRRARPRRGTTAVVFAVACVVVAFFMKRGINLYDEGVILTSALQIQAGDVVHRDFYYVYGPATLWMVALLWKLTAYQFIAARLYSVVILAAIVALSYRLMRYLPPVVGWTFAAIVLLSVMSLESYLYPGVSLHRRQPDRRGTADRGDAGRVELAAVRGVPVPLRC